MRLVSQKAKPVLRAQRAFQAWSKLPWTALAGAIGCAFLLGAAPPLFAPRSSSHPGQSPVLSPAPSPGPSSGPHPAPSPVPSPGPHPGVGLEAPVPKAVPLKAALRARAARWRRAEMSLDTGTDLVRMSRHAAGGRVSLGPGSDSAAWSAFLGPTNEVHIPSAKRWLERVDAATALSQLQLPAARELDLAASLKALEKAILADALYVRLVSRPVPELGTVAAARWQTESLELAVFDDTVAEYRTTYAYDLRHRGRAANVERAARRLDGALIKPGGVLSFNEQVGERTVSRGYAAATQLGRGGRRVDGIGGGVCQVAATLHAAAFLGGFEVLEHHPHTRGSRYIEVGLDAAVSWPAKDLRLRNPYRFFVRVVATAYRGEVRVRLVGARAAPPVEWSSRVVKTTPPPTEKIVDRGLPRGESVLEDQGAPGRVVELQRTIRWPSGPRTERFELRYPSVKRVLRVAR